ncbi:GalNAc(5)-diNAcBac-PP-undecaprenol beta-1,3-glucosyltransferase [Rosistilla ulvae]|uniref:GalNAc(5)-diNAcBac-PP-undecaprenol beta-1,3-glucosyltransferase n=1 Tax=Rosistilla ulvae TaxID=1930277 RepID=A0A517M0E1_9BACT|nr:glycosyltransferase family 2 protein [Rosistilla ulvae]QDS88342.1 GalNAc(5)-diNAcBac-PP-undecaprenol beta-1,3-glucosyltransferase [Rosistilla ulvae]
MSRQPLVSIILPTFNRASFLPKAIAAIREQQLTDWELIVIDDGSTDQTAPLLRKLVNGMPQAYRYLRQENQGAYAARNTGLDYVRGKYVAFYDSDDLWLPHHLQKCVTALELNQDVDWVYSASRIVDFASERVLNENCFQEGGRARKFRNLPVERRDDLYVLKQAGLMEAVLDGAGLYSGLQNSVIRSRFFQGRRFATEFYNEAEDQVIVIRALAANIRFAYFDSVHVEYCVHDNNSSGAALNLPRHKQLRLSEGLIRGYEQLSEQVALSGASKLALRRKLAKLYMWHLGYHSHWRFGDKQAAIAAYRKSIQLDPWNWRYRKTYLLALARPVCTTDAQQSAETKVEKG